jgi:polyhydroxyalkanoate synthesis regulator phasin
MTLDPSNRIKLATALIVLSCSASAAFAQALPPVAPLPGDSLIDDILPPILPPIFPPPPAQPLIIDRALIIPPATLPNQVLAPLAPERPLTPEVPLLTQTVKDLVKDFKTTRQEFLRGQEELLRQLKNATGQEREIIREQLKERLNEWRELQKQHLRELHDQAREMTRDLPALNEVINAGKDGVRGGLPEVR